MHGLGGLWGDGGHKWKENGEQPGKSQRKAWFPKMKMPSTQPGVR